MALSGAAPLPPLPGGSAPLGGLGEGDGGDVDPEMVAKIVGELKNRGIFDQIRNECLAEADTKVSEAAEGLWRCPGENVILILSVLCPFPSPRTRTFVSVWRARSTASWPRRTRGGTQT